MILANVFSIIMIAIILWVFNYFYQPFGKNFIALHMNQLIFIILITFSVISAQTIYVSDSATDENIPINANNEWTIEHYGKKLHIILDTENRKIDGDVIYLFIDKFENGRYLPFDSKSISNNSKNKILFDYVFTEAGKYKLYHVDISQAKIASIDITIAEDKNASDINSRIANYSNAKLNFYKNILYGGVTIGHTHQISINEDFGEIHVKITNNTPLNTDVILVYFWRKEHRSFEYDQFVESKKFSVERNWNSTFFKYKFNLAGEYKIVVYNQDEVLIGSGYINVLK